MNIKQRVVLIVFISGVLTALSEHSIEVTAFGGLLTIIGVCLVSLFFNKRT